MATTVIGVGIGVADLENMADDTQDYEDVIVVDGGQVCKKISGNNRFIGLDRVAEVSAEFSNPFQLVAMLEKQLDYPLVYDHFVTREPLDVVSTDVRTPTEHRLYVQSLGL